MSIGISTKKVNKLSFGKKNIVRATIGKTVVYDKTVTEAPPVISGDTFEFIIDQTTNDPSAMISYAGANAEFTAAHMDYDKDTFDYGGWKDTWIMKAFKPCMLHADGSVAYYLNPDNLSQKADGSDATSDLTSTDHDMNAMVEVSQIWIKEKEIDEDHFHIYLSPTKADGYDCWTHYDANNELQDKYYFAMYKGSLDSNNKIRSLSGKTPNASTAGNLQKQYCQANGAGWDCREWSFQRLMQYVSMLVSKTTDCQTAFGGGVASSDTDGKAYRGSILTTGRHEDKGMFYGKNDYTDHVIFFGMEDFWGNLYDLTNGLQCNGDNMYVKMTPGTADGSTGTEYTDTVTDYIAVAKTDLGRSSTDALNISSVTKMKLLPGKGLLAKAGDSTIGHGYCDYWYDETGHKWAHCGGYYGTYGRYCGVFSVNCNYTLSNSYTHSGVSLAFKK